MILRRIYVKGRKYPYYFHPEIQTYHELCEFSDANPDVDVWNLDNATYFFDDLSEAEQDQYWRETFLRIMDPNKTREVLDNLDNCPEYKVRWNHYGSKHNPNDAHISGVGKPIPEIETFLN